MGWFSNAYDNISNAIADFDASRMLDDAADAIVSARDSVVEATSSAIEWTVETGAPAVANGAAWVVAATPLGYIARGAEAAGLGDPTGIAEKHRQAEEAIIGFGKFVINDPARAGAVLAQGASNAVTSTVGLIGDLGRNAVGLTIDVAHNVAWNSTIRPLINAGYSIGQNEDDPPLIEGTDFFAATKILNGGGGLDKAMKWTTWMNDNTQFVERIKGEYLADMRRTITDDAGNVIENPEYMREIELGEGEEAPEYAKIIENPNANYERTILYGTQAIVEIPAFLVATAATGGAAGTIFALKWGGKGLQTANAVRRADLVADAIELTDKAAKISSKSAKAVETTKDVAHTSKMAGPIAEQTSSKVSKLTTKADEIARGERLGTATENLTNWIKKKFPGGEDARQTMTQSDLMEYLAKDAEKLRSAETKLDKLISSGQATEKEILRQTKEIKAAQSALEDARTSVNRFASSSGNSLEEVSYEAAKSAAKTTEDLGVVDSMKRGWEIGTHKTARFVDPSRSPIIDTVGVGLSFGMGVYADKKNADAQKQSGIEISKSSASSIVREDTERAKRLGEDTSWFKEFNEQPGNLRNRFQEAQPRQNGSTSESLPGGDIDRGLQSGTFNNRANALVTPIDTPLFKVEVSQEAADQLRQAIRSQ